jgi:hypothetical protein
LSLSPLRLPRRGVVPPAGVPDGSQVQEGPIRLLRVSAQRWLSYTLRAMARPSLIVPTIGLLVSCATTTSDIGQVREVAPGTYKIGVSGGAGSVVFRSHEAADAAVGQAGQYCHAKGQKLVIVPTTGRDVIFRCGEKTTPGE